MPVTVAHGARRRTRVLPGLYSLECSLFADDRRRLLTRSTPTAEQSGEYLLVFERGSKRAVGRVKPARRCA